MRLTPEQINYLYPVTGMDLYTRGVRVRRTSTLASGSPPRYRGRIKELSRSSLSKLAFVVAATEVKFMSMLTLTYGLNYPHTGREVKKHLNKVLLCLTRRHGKFSYLWFMEFQKRGAPHVHIMLSILEPGDYDRESFAVDWARISVEFDALYCDLKNRRVGGTVRACVEVHRHPRQWENIRVLDGAAHYVTKYARKVGQKAVPPDFALSGRFWGHSRDVAPKAIALDLKTSEEALRSLLAYCGRSDIAKWEVIPKLVTLPGK